MCIGNHADVSANYVNGQLRALWENAESCVKKHVVANQRPTQRELEYGFALSKFYYGSLSDTRSTTDSLAFYASFGCPSIDFVCNHEVILTLELLGGHYYVDTNNAAARVDLSQRRHIERQKIAFRIPFSPHGVGHVHCDEVGNAKEYNLDFVVLDTKEATFCEELCHAPSVVSGHSHKVTAQDTPALTYYLRTHYLDLLKRAGLHVFYTIPFFDDIKGNELIDYSLASNPSGVDVLEITVAQMNKYLKDIWLQAVTEANHGRITYLVEHRATVKTGDFQLELALRAPEVLPLCRHEVALTFDIASLGISSRYVSHNTPYGFKDWKITFLIHTDLDHSEKRKRLRVNVATAHYSDALSSTPHTLADQTLFDRLQDVVVEYLHTAYLKLFEDVHNALIYDSTFHFVLPAAKIEPITDEGCWTVGGCKLSGINGHVCWMTAIEQMLGFQGPLPYDFVTSVSQGSIDRQLAAQWDIATRKVGGRLSEAYALARYVFSYNGQTHFTASFDAPKVQLVCEPGPQKAIVHLRLKEGVFKTLTASGAYDASALEYRIGQWEVAFEVSLELRDCSTNADVPEFLVKHFGHGDYRNYKQLVLNFSTAKFVKIVPTQTVSAEEAYTLQYTREKRDALLHFLKECYFPVLTASGHHILHTIPVTVAQGSTDSLSLTALDFRVSPIPFALSDKFRDGLNGRYERNAILFLGMTQHRPLPRPLPALGFWLTAGFSREIPSATAVFSRRIFLDSKLVPLLSAINRQTTIVPSSPTVEHGKWITDLAQWNVHPLRQNEECRFEEVTRAGAHNALEFEWVNRENWKYERGSPNRAGGSWNIDCLTTNTLSVPTGTLSDTCVVKLHGSVVLKFDSTVHGETANHWQSEAIAQWSTTITLATTSTGITVTATSDDIVPQFKDHTAEKYRHAHSSAYHVDAVAQLKEHLPTVSIAPIVAELRTALEGVWAHLFASASEWQTDALQAGALSARLPTFTRGGDLLLELRPYALAQDLWKAHEVVSVTTAAAEPAVVFSIPPMPLSLPASNGLRVVQNGNGVTQNGNGVALSGNGAVNGYVQTTNGHRLSIDTWAPASASDALSPSPYVTPLMYAECAKPKGEGIIAASRKDAYRGGRRGGGRIY